MRATFFAANVLAVLALTGLLAAWAGFSAGARASDYASVASAAHNNPLCSCLFTIF